MNKSSPTTTTSQGKASNEAVPIFLRKTYHMIDTCDQSVACWSEDGETFIVKDTDVFEKKIIPQFFKHSKFSSFVRQLNFYGFRKIKYADTIKIDAKLEAETANFWRFRHEKFIRGKPEYLIEIKRSNGHQASTTKATTATVPTSSLPAQPVVIKSLDGNQVVVTDASLKNEVTTLKKRIEAMTKNIDDLTHMVHKVSLKQEEEPAARASPTHTLGNKRKKTTQAEPTVRPDISPSNMDMDDLDLKVDDLDLDVDVGSFPPLPATTHLTTRETSDASKLTDDDFVDHLFTAFGEEDNMEGLLDELPASTSTSNASTTSSSPPLAMEEEDDNSPDPKLMKRLSDALKMLPKEMQEMIVDRLVANIVGTDSMERNVKAACALSDATTTKPKITARPQPCSRAAPTEMSMPLAAATLAALLSQYSEAVKKADANNVVQKEKPLPPVIPMHA